MGSGYNHTKHTRTHPNNLEATGTLNKMKERTQKGNWRRDSNPGPRRRSYRLGQRLYEHLQSRDCSPTHPLNLTFIYSHCRSLIVYSRVRGFQSWTFLVSKSWTIGRTSLPRCLALESCDTLPGFRGGPATVSTFCVYPQQHHLENGNGHVLDACASLWSSNVHPWSVPKGVQEIRERSFECAPSASGSSPSCTRLIDRRLFTIYISRSI